MASIIETIKNVVSGRFIRMGSTSNVPVKAAYKNSVSIVKVTERTVRLGIRYDHIKAVMEKEAQRTEPKTQRADNNVWEVEGRVAFNTKTNNRTLRAYTVARHSNSRSMYIVTMDGITSMYEEIPDDIKEYITPSYFNKSGEYPVCISVSLDKIYMLGNYGESRFAV